MIVRDESRIAVDRILEKCLVDPVQGLNNGLVFVVAKKELDIGKAQLDWLVHVGVSRAEDVLAVEDYLDAGEGFWRLMDAGVVKEAICTSTKKRLQHILHVIDELGRVDRLVDKDLPAQPTKGSVRGQHTVVVACDGNLSVNCIAPALCPAESREELIWASRHFVRVGDERDRHVLDSHVHA